MTTTPLHGTCWRCRKIDDLVTVPTAMGDEHWCPRCLTRVAAQYEGMRNDPTLRTEMVAEQIPLTKGGQGHEDEDVEETGGALLVPLAIGAIVAAAFLAAWCCR